MTDIDKDRKARAGGYGVAGVDPIRTFVAEAVGTFLLVLIGTGVACAAVLRLETAGPAYDSLAIALSFGLVLVALVAALGQVSGAHVNPAVTVGLASIGKFPWRHVPGYLAAQLAGGILAALVVWGAYGDQARDVANLGAPATRTGGDGHAEPARRGANRVPAGLHRRRGRDRPPGCPRACSRWRSGSPWPPACSSAAPSVEGPVTRREPPGR